MEPAASPSPREWEQTGSAGVGAGAGSFRSSRLRVCLAGVRTGGGTHSLDPWILAVLLPALFPGRVLADLASPHNAARAVWGNHLKQGGKKVKRSPAPASRQAACPSFTSSHGMAAGLDHPRGMWREDQAAAEPGGGQGAHRGANLHPTPSALHPARCQSCVGVLLRCQIHVGVLLKGVQGGDKRWPWETTLAHGVRVSIFMGFRHG